MLNILVLGNGARENAIYDILSIQCENKIYIKDIDDFYYIKLFCIENNIQLVIPSNEEYLCNGIVDYLQIEIPSIKVFGPNKYQARIEGSKHFSKNLMDILNIPTSSYLCCPTIESVYHEEPTYGTGSLCFENLPVLKYNGLAKGKGVYLPNSREEISPIIHNLFKLGADGIIIEPRLYGTEVSVLAFCNGVEAVLMPQAQDYKRIYDGDKGPNTGGMGAICPANILTDVELKEVKICMDKVVKYLNYKGVLYAGLMKTTNGIFFLEFNCRFGDPEAQVILNLLDINYCKLDGILLSCIDGKELHIQWKKLSAAVVVLSHIDYPMSKLDVPVEIKYIQPITNHSIKIYESNVINEKNEKSTTGGRVLSMVSVDNTLHEALENIYNNIYKIQYDGAYYRRDIGYNNIITESNNPINIGVLASGNGTCIEKLLERQSEYVKIIITNKSDAKVIEKAKKYKIPFFFIPQKNLTQTEYYERIVNVLRLYDVEFVILAGFMKIVSDVLFEEFFTVNIHPSLLPKYGGLMDLAVHQKVIENKEIFSGCTLHKVTNDVDKGRILMQKQYKLQDAETGSSLKINIQKLEKECILEYVDIYNQTQTTIRYGVNIQEGNAFVEELKKTNKEIGGFCANYNYKDLRLAASADGCGTKLDLANTYNMLDTIGIDLVAMNVNDLIAGGAKPLFFMDYIALDKMNKSKCNTIIKGINKGCKLANCTLIGGETAEMGGTYLKNKLDLAGFAFGEIEYELPRREEMNDRCVLYGILSSGIHSNGYTLVRKLLQKAKNMSGASSLSSLPTPSIEEILTPTRIYTGVSKLCKMYPENILGIAHITGGGFHDNLIRIIPNNLNYVLTSWKFPPIFHWIQEESNLSRKEMLSTFNCGYGMVIISNKIFNIYIYIIIDIDIDLTLIGRLV